LGWQISVLGAALAFGVAEESVARLYAAGVIPGLMIAVMIAAYVVWQRASSISARHSEGLSADRSMPEAERPVAESMAGGQKG
jgi:TRAP-type C4-dicarboxylate transport system permease large subunit